MKRHFVPALLLFSSILILPLRLVAADARRVFTNAVAVGQSEDALKWMQAAALDLDDQHGADLLLAAKEKGATIGWLQAPAKPHDLAAWSWHKLRDAGWIMSLTPRDLDGDGDPDVVFTCEEHDQLGVVWYENPHHGQRDTQPTDTR